MAYKKWKRLTKDEVEKYKKIYLEAFRETHGLVLLSCENTGIPHDKVIGWQKEDENFKNQMDEIKKSTEDFVTGQLYRAIANGNVTSIIFWLKTHGWKETSKVEVDNVSDVDVTAAVAEIRKQIIGK